MQIIQDTLHNFMASGLGQAVEGFLLPLICIAVVAIVAVAFALRHRVTAKTVRREQMRSLGLTKSNYKMKLRAAQNEFSVAQSQLNRARFYPMTAQVSEDRFRKAQINLYKIRSFAA